MNVVSLIHEYLIDHDLYGKRFRVEHLFWSHVEVRSLDHDYIMRYESIGKNMICASVGFIENNKYKYHHADDFELSSGVPTFHMLGQRRLGPIENPEFIGEVEDVLIEFLENHDEWVDRRMKYITRKLDNRL